MRSLCAWLTDMWWALCDAIDPADTEYDDDA